MCTPLLHALVYDAIVLPTDGSDAAADAADHAASLADRYGAVVHVLSVVELPQSADPGRAAESDRVRPKHDERREAARRLAERLEDDGVAVEVGVELGSPSRVILEYAADVDADLVVMSTHARSGVKRFLYGSVTERVIQDGTVPVLAVQR